MGNEKKQAKDARKYAREHRTEITEKHLRRYARITIFMAGSSGAGKTETAEEILEKIPRDILHLEPDDLRKEFPGYDGENAPIFQSAVTYLADEIYKTAVERGVDLLFDATFSGVARLDEYIQLSLDKNRAVSVEYVYQDPVKAWEFVCGRAGREGRTVPKDIHVRSYFGARNSVNAAKKKYGGRICLNLSIKDLGGKTVKTHENAKSVDKYIPEVYTEETLAAKLAGKGD